MCSTHTQSERENNYSLSDFTNILLKNDSTGIPHSSNTNVIEKHKQRDTIDQSNTNHSRGRTDNLADRESRRTVPQARLPRHKLGLYVYTIINIIE